VRVLDLCNRADLNAELARVGADRECWDTFAAKRGVLAIGIPELSTATANILKQTALVAGGDCAVHHSVVSGRVRRSDAVLFVTPRQLDGVLVRLKSQPACVACLASELEQLGERYIRPALPIRLGDRVVDLARRTYVMGIVNVTPDSFSDGGRFLDPAAAVAQALRMQDEGADFIDIGAESTRPGAEPVRAAVQLKRLLPVLTRVRRGIKIPVSVDTTSARVAELAIAEGAVMVNDVSALRLDRRMPRVVARTRVPCVVMHMQGQPRTMQRNPRYRNLMAEVAAFLDDAVARGERAGIERSQLIIDPGIGFGKTREHNLEILRRLRELRSLGLPVLVGPSRKRFVGETLKLGVSDRLEGTLAACVMAARNGANIVRVHDVRATVRALKLADAIAGRN